MTYISDIPKLVKVVNTLVSHEDKVKQYFLAELKPHVMPLNNIDDRMIRIFLLANADRQNTGEENKNLITATATFKKYLNDGLIHKYIQIGPQKGHADLLSCLCDIKGMQQKTANLKIRRVVSR